MATKKEGNIPEIDISKVSNFEAAAKMDKSLKKDYEASRKKSRGKFNFSEPEIVNLPSGGRLYEAVTDDEDVLNGKILLYPMTAKEEEILSTQRFIKDGTATRRVLDRCIASDIDAKDILIYDSNYLLFFLRQISYGDEYEFELTCQNSYCGKKFDYKVKISELEFEELSEEIEEPIIIKLPRSKYTVNMVMARLYHTEDIVSRNRKRKAIDGEGTKSTIDRYISTTVSILDRDGDEVPKQDWEEFYESLVGIDIAEIRDRTDISNGVDSLENVVCPYCETDYSGTIPIDINFFRF